jgi:hypothetical protein
VLLVNRIDEVTHGHKVSFAMELIYADAQDSSSLHLYVPCPSLHTRFVHIPGLSTWVCVLFALAHSIWCVMLVCFSSQQPILRRPRTESHRIMLSVAKSLLWKKISAPQCSFSLFSPGCLILPFIVLSVGL